MFYSLLYFQDTNLYKKPLFIGKREELKHK